jgi:hypothetical protein
MRVWMSAFGVGNAYKLRSVSVSVFSTPISIEPKLAAVQKWCLGVVHHNISLSEYESDFLSGPALYHGTNTCLTQSQLRKFVHTYTTVMIDWTTVIILAVECQNRSTCPFCKFNPSYALPMSLLHFEPTPFYSIAVIMQLSESTCPIQKLTLITQCHNSLKHDHWNLMIDGHSSYWRQRRSHLIT